MIRLALRMLTRDTTKWLGVLLGIILSTFLITHMLSMFTGMMERSYALVSDIPQADIWVMDPAVEYCDEPMPMPDTALERVRGVAGVAWAVPLHSGSLRARLPTGDFRSVAIIGLDDATLVGAPATIVEGDVFSLRQADAAILDTASARSTFRVPLDSARHWSHEGHQADPGVLRDVRVGDDVLVNDHRLTVIGLADLGPRFLTKPVLYTTYSRAIQISPAQRHMLSFVLAKAADGEDPTTLARAIERHTGLRARTAHEFADDTYWYYVRYTGVVSRIGLMVGIGVVTGVCVSALLLYLFTNENARYYATFKALGTTNATIVRMVTAQAATAGIIGYAIGVGASTLVGVLFRGRDMPYQPQWWTLAASASAMILVCCIATIASLRGVLKLEPGSVFKT